MGLQARNISSPRYGEDTAKAHHHDEKGIKDHGGESSLEIKGRGSPPRKSENTPTHVSELLIDFASHHESSWVHHYMSIHMDKMTS